MIRPAWRSQVAMPLLLTVLLCQSWRVGAAGDTVAVSTEDDGASPADGVVKAPAYVDHLIVGLVPLAIDSDEGAGAATLGRPRSLTVESSVTRVSPSSRRDHAFGVGTDEPTTEAGVAVRGRYDTGNYGVLGVDGTLRFGNPLASLGGDVGETSNRPVVGGTLTLSDSGLPVGHGWTVDSAVGVVDPHFIRLARAQSQLYLPSQPLLGVDVSVSALSGDRPGAVDASSSFNLSLGEPGLPGGLRLAQFRGLGGFEIAGGGEVRPAPGFAIGIQAIDAMNVRDPYSVVFGDLVGGGRVDGRAVLVAASAGGADWRVQANLQHSRLDRVGTTGKSIVLPSALSGLDAASFGPGSATGGWIDGVLDRGRLTQRAGVFYLDPRLAWGASPMINDAYGGYYRIAMSDARWRWYASVDVNRSVSGVGLNSEFFDLGVRRQFGGLAIGGEAALRVVALGRRDAGTAFDESPDGAKQLNAYVEFGSRLGLTRLETSYGFDREEQLVHLSATQTWTLPSSLPSSSRLSTQVFYDTRRDRTLGSDGGTTRADGFGVAITAGGDVLDTINVDASLAYGGTSGGTAGILAESANVGGIGAFGSSYSQRGRNFSATLAANARLSPRWTVTGSFTSSETNLQQALGYYGVDGALPGLLATATPSTRDRFRLLSATVAIRYSLAAGRASSPIGRKSFAGQGSGGISGHVYLDTNNNGYRDPGEVGVRDVALILDGRIAARTDASGYYRIDDVSEGRHEIRVQADALPLPWHYAPDERSTAASFESGFVGDVEVGVRKTALLNIRATKMDR